MVIENMNIYEKTDEELYSTVMFVVVFSFIFYFPSHLLFFYKGLKSTFSFHLSWISELNYYGKYKKGYNQNKLSFDVEFRVSVNPFVLVDKFNLC